MDIERIKELQTRIAELTYRGISNPAWKSAALDFMEASVISSVKFHLTLPDGSVKQEFAPSNQACTEFGELRQLMATPEHGTWLSATLTLTREGDFSYDFNYDNKPNWGSPEPTLDAFIEDLEKYPRPESEIPEWYPRKV
ncbi:hypothetical protein DDK01_17940 [Mycobacteroides abscessus]|uniref:immunity protein YezG family protein n=1 Tax=Mycobacteroides abscessus TaxID=36809 RepID=UPI000D3ED201|nr:immunity protein YezG family protein [Mycobacteroides abscessus]PVA91840.1 hypothetical protein DDK01_17940 [Mycobacteroides abscessus]